MKRRRFFKSAAGFGAGMVLSDIIRLYTGVQHSIFREAFAATADIPSRAYMNFHLYGAPSRWQFDQWLTPNPTDMTLSAATASTWNRGIATAFTNNQPEYRLYNYRGVRVPYQYQYGVATKTGTRPMSDLLDHMAVIRGYISAADGHEINAPLQTFPDPAAPSLSGLAADYRQDYISAVAASFTVHPFHSLTGQSLSTITDHYSGGGSIYGLMKSFRTSATTKQGLLGLDAIKSVIDQMHDAANAQASAGNARSAAIKDQLKNARNLALFAAEDLTALWSTLYNKYNTIAVSSTRGTSNLPGFSESAIQFATGEPLSSDGRALNAAYDMRQALMTATPPTHIARSFALAEYCLTRKISGSLMVGVNSVMDNVQFLNAGDSTNSIGSIYCDQHTVPPRLGTVVNSGFYRALASCLLEFIDTLKAQPGANGGTLFDDTVIHVTGDFSRAPRDDSTGTDHGWNAQVASVFTGAIDGPMIVGNIASSGQGGYSGIWGKGAAVDFNGTSETLSPRHVGAAVAHLLGVKNPWSFTNLVWQLNSSGRLQAKIGAKIV